MKSNTKHLLLILIILAMFISGCLRRVDTSSKFDPPPGCHYEAEYLGPAPNSNLTDSDAGSIFVVVTVCD